MTEHTLIYDPTLRRPGCVLIQAMGGGSSDALYRFFAPRDWLVAPTPGMQRITGTTEQWERAAALIREATDAG